MKITTTSSMLISYTTLVKILTASSQQVNKFGARSPTFVCYKVFFNV